MRQLVAFVPAENGQRALDIAKTCGGINLLRVAGAGADTSMDAVWIHVENDKVDALVSRLQEIPDLRLTLLPTGVIALTPPPDQAPEQVTDVSLRSPLEVFLGGLQSIGSWTGLMGYAGCAAVVVWVGLHTNTVFLLTAAMLIAPFAGPAMTLAMGTARGDRTLIFRSLARYFASLALTVVVAALLSTVFQQEIATALMVENSLISVVAVLLPLTAGAAGALNLCQSERNSLVTAAGPGVLVAASLAPPAGMIGMAGAIGEWGMVKNGIFVLLLQLVGINLSGALVFALFGLSPKGVRYDRGRPGLRWGSLALTAVGLAALLGWQFQDRPDLERATRTQRLAHLVNQTLDDSAEVHPVDIEVRFTRPDIKGQNTALVVVYAQKRPGTTGAPEAIAKQVGDRIRQQIQAGDFNVTPLVDVTVIEPPALK